MSKNPYYQSRAAAGRQFASELSEFRYENTAVLALSPGGVVIATEIAKALHSIAALLLLRDVYLPGGQTAFGVINDQGGFTHNESIAAAQIEDFEIEYRGNLEASKADALHELHLIGQKGELTHRYFNGRTVIIVTDFAKTGTAFRAAMDFLKPAKTDKIVLVSAIAHLKAVDIMHQLGDKLVVGRATDKDFPTEHYFEDNEIPQTPELIQMMEQIVLQW